MASTNLIYTKAIQKCGEKNEEQKNKVSSHIYYIAWGGGYK